MNPLTKRARERQQYEDRLNIIIAALAGIFLGVMLALAI